MLGHSSTNPSYKVYMYNHTFNNWNMQVTPTLFDEVRYII